MRVAVYTICLNEVKHVDRWMDSMSEADGVYVTDTGSTDGTQELLRKRGAIVHQAKVIPWRFDVARNVSLQVVPADVDVCVSTDLDEVLSPGWCEQLKAAWTPTTDRLRYQYVWNVLPDGRDGTTFWYDKIHSRKGFRWVKPVHEVMTFAGAERQTYCDTFKLYHYPDPTKSRGSYLPLLELGCREDPDDDRNSHYLGREYMYYGRFDDAIRELKRHLSLPRAIWDSERAASMRFLGRCYCWKGDRVEAKRWFYRAIAEQPNEREPWVELGKLLYDERDHRGAYYAMTQALAIREKPLTYINDPEAWGSLPWDVAGVCAGVLGLDREGLGYMEEALKLAPTDPRLQKNVLLQRQKLG